MKEYIVSRWMTSPVITVTPETSLEEARQLIAAHHIRALPVVEDDKLVGIITRRGLLRLDLSFVDEGSAEAGAPHEIETMREVMTRRPITVTGSTSMAEAAQIMLENKITALPVVHGEDLVGILTNSDVMRFYTARHQDIAAELLIRDYMTENVETIEPDGALLEAHRLMSMGHFRSLPVVKNDQLLGIITRTDLMSSDPSRRFSRNQQEESMQILTTPVEKIMSAPVITVRPESSVTEAAFLMMDNKIHSLPVLDAEQKLVGIFTESDLFLITSQKLNN